MTREEIGNRLRTIRRIRDRSQRKLAKDVGLCKEAVLHTEGGTREMSLDEAANYARVLCFCLDAFVRTEADGQWNISACLLPYTPPACG